MYVCMAQSKVMKTCWFLFSGDYTLNKTLYYIPFLPVYGPISCTGPLKMSDCVHMYPLMRNVFQSAETFTDIKHWWQHVYLIFLYWLHLVSFGDELQSVSNRSQTLLLTPSLHRKGMSERVMNLTDWAVLKHIW